MKLLKQRNKMSIIFAGIFIVILGLLALVYIFCRDFGNDAKIRSEQKNKKENTGIRSEQPQMQIPLNDYDDSKFYTVGDSGIRYYVDNKYRGVAGVDVSHYQSEIEWDKVKEAGIEFAIIQAAYRGWGDNGAIVIGEAFEEQIEGALNAGIEVGVYFFSQALNEEEAIEEANYVLSLIDGYNITYPVVFDWEIPNTEARTNGMNMLTLTTCADAFCRTVKEAGYEPCVYFNKDFGYEQYNLESLKEYTFWLAEYGEFPTFEYEFDMWQYTENGSVPGINGDVDLNIMFKKK